MSDDTPKRYRAVRMTTPGFIVWADYTIVAVCNTSSALNNKEHAERIARLLNEDEAPRMPPTLQPGLPKVSLLRDLFQLYAPVLPEAYWTLLLKPTPSPSAFMPTDITKLQASHAKAYADAMLAEQEKQP